MNHERSSPASPAPPPYPFHSQPQDGAASLPRAPAPSELAARRKKHRETFNLGRIDRLDDLLRSLDILVYAELSAIYYMDCSFIRFVIRAFIQLLFITPKPSLFPEPPGNRPYIGGLFGSNILCIFMHVVLDTPSAGEATRGYLHGGLAMDFIGQKGPSSKIHLLLLDLFVVALQLVQLSVHVLRRKLKEASSVTIAVTTTSGTQYPAPAVSAGQTVEDEEQGLRRSAVLERQQDIELQALDPSGIASVPADGSGAASAGASDNEALLASTAAPQRRNSNIFDAFNSGQIVVADLDLPKTVKEQFWAYQMAPRDTTGVDAGRAMRERFARRVLRWQLETPARSQTELG